MITFNNVNKTFKTKKKTVEAVKDLSFSVNPGEIFGLLGPNGAGKTTSLRMLSTLLKPSSGSIDVYGYDTVNSSKEVRERIGFLSSDMNLTGNLSPREYLKFFGNLNHIDEEKLDRRIEELKGYFEMDKFIDRKVGTFSTGMKQKTLISIALIHDPEVIVFDEPTNGLDIMTARQVLDFLKDLRKKGKTIILSTHIMSVAQKMCDRIAIVHEGRLKEIGTLKYLLEKTGTDELEDAFFNIVEVK